MYEIRKENVGFYKGVGLNTWNWVVKINSIIFGVYSF